MAAQELISRYVKCSGVRFRPPSTKLRECDAEQIRRFYLKGASQTKLSEMFGVSRGHINNIVSLRRWK